MTNVDKMQTPEEKLIDRLTDATMVAYIGDYEYASRTALRKELRKKISANILPMIPQQKGNLKPAQQMGIAVVVQEVAADVFGYKKRVE